jgi:cytoskeleton protein RodZ
MNDNSEISVGQRLRRAREAMKLTITDISQQLLISKKNLIALESDDYSTIPAEVYVRGYLRSYAKFLKLPIDEILANYNENNNNPDIGNKSDQQSFVVAQNECKKTPYIRWISYGIGLLFILLIIIWMYDARKSGKMTTELTAPEVNTVTSDTANAQQPQSQQSVNQAVLEKKVDSEAVVPTGEQKNIDL